MTFKKLMTAFAVMASLCLSVTASALTSNFTNYVTGQTLTAASLNSLQTNYTNGDNAILDGDTFTGNMLWNSGVDILMYSDVATTLKFSVDAATGHMIGAPSMEGFHTNCGFSNSGTTWTLAGYDGTALSATNPCVIAVRSNTAGRTALAYFTANVTFTHGATSDTDGNLFGIADANWANTMPFFLGVVYDGTTPYVTISRLPYKVTGAAATAFCQKTDTDCDAQLDVMILTTGLTLANWVNLPITQVGWFNMTYATTGSAWTAAVAEPNGFNEEYTKIPFSMPLAQNGAASGTYFLANAGTAPVFTTQAQDYYISPSGQIHDFFNNDADGGTDGSGAVTTQMSIPFTMSPTAATTNPIVAVAYILSVGQGTAMPATIQIVVGNTYINFFGQANTAGALQNTLYTYKNDAFTNGGRTVLGSFFYETQ